MSDKSRLVAFLLAWFLGPFGAHRFYVGKTGSAVAQLLLTFIIVGIIWAFVDMIIILVGGFTDAEGRKITEWMPSPQQQQPTA